MGRMGGGRRKREGGIDKKRKGLKGRAKYMEERRMGVGREGGQKKKGGREERGIGGRKEEGSREGKGEGGA